MWIVKHAPHLKDGLQWLQQLSDQQSKLLRTTLTKTRQGEEQSDKSFEIKIANRLQLSSGRLGPESAPFLVMFTIATKPGSTLFQPMDAFAIPVYSHTLLMPIESNYERIDEACRRIY